MVGGEKEPGGDLVHGMGKGTCVRPSARCRPRAWCNCVVLAEGADACAGPGLLWPRMMCADLKRCCYRFGPRAPSQGPARVSTIYDDVMFLDLPPILAHRSPSPFHPRRAYPYHYAPLMQVRGGTVTDPACLTAPLPCPPCCGGMHSPQLDATCHSHAYARPTYSSSMPPP